MARYTDIDLLIDKIEETDWYHISKQGELVSGANSKDDIPLYKHSDIVEVLNNAPIADVVPKSEVEKFSEDIKLEFYREFDEIIPSIMADKIDELKKEIHGEK